MTGKDSKKDIPTRPHTSEEIILDNLKTILVYPVYVYIMFNKLLYDAQPIKCHIYFFKKLRLLTDFS